MPPKKLKESLNNHEREMKAKGRVQDRQYTAGPLMHADTAGRRNEEALRGQQRQEYGQLRLRQENNTDANNVETSDDNDRAYGVVPHEETAYAQPGDDFYDNDAQRIQQLHGEIERLNERIRNGDNTVRKLQGDLTAERAKLELREQQADTDRKAAQKSAEEAGKLLKSKSRYKLAALIGIPLGIIGGSGAVAGILAGLGYFSNNPAAFQVNDDILLDIDIGKGAVFNPLENDVGANPETLEIVGADAGSKTIKTVVGEGVWTADPSEGTIKFAPESAFRKNPTPIEYKVHSLEDPKKEGAAKCILRYSGIFTLRPIFDNSFVAGSPITIDVLAGQSEADPATVEIRQADGTYAATLKVDGEGTWSVDSTTGAITFTPDAALVGSPGSIIIRANNKSGSDPQEVSLMISGDAPAIPDLVMKVADLEGANSGQAPKPGNPVKIDDIAKLTSGRLGKLDQASFRLIDASGNEVTSLTIQNEGNWSVDSAGTAIYSSGPSALKPPSPIKCIIRDDRQRKSNVFQIRFTTFTPPLAINYYYPDALPDIDFSKPIGPGNELKSLILYPSRLGIRGDFDIDWKTIRIVGPMPLDGTIPRAHFDYRDDKTAPETVQTVTVEGEGIWRVSKNGNVTFNSAGATNSNDELPADWSHGFVRWPTPVGFTVKDVKGNESNVALLWINPAIGQLRTAIDAANSQSNSQFWSTFTTEILSKGHPLGTILAVTNMTCRTTLQALDAVNRILLNSTARYNEDDYKAGELTWGVTNNMAQPKLADFALNMKLLSMDDFKDQKTRDLADRAIRLGLIRRLLAEVLGAG